MRSSGVLLVLVVIALMPYMLSSAVVSAQESTSPNTQWRKAIMNDDTELLRRMLDNARSPREQVEELSQNGKSALMIACKTGDLHFVQQLLVLGADEHASTTTGGTPFMFASLGGHTDIVRLLATKGVDINAQGANGWSATTIAAAKGYAELLSTLLAMQTDVNAQDVYSWTPLMRAVDNGHVAAVKVLLQETRLALNTQDETGNTALHHAASNGNADMLSLLLEAGIDQSVQNSSGFVAAQLVSALSNSEELLALFSKD